MTPKHEFAHREFLEIRIDTDETNKLHDFLSLGQHFLDKWELSPQKEAELKKFATEFLADWNTFIKEEKDR